MSILTLKDPREIFSLTEWDQLKSDSEQLENGYRANQYNLLGKVAELAAKLQSDERLRASFLVDLEASDREPKSEENLLAHVMGYVMMAQTDNQRKLLWKRVRAVEYLSSVHSIKPAGIAEALREKGGLEAVVRQAAVDDPIRRKRPASKERPKQVLLDIKSIAEPKTKRLTLIIRADLMTTINRIKSGRSITLTGTRCIDRRDKEIIAIDDAYSYGRLKWGR